MPVQKFGSIEEMNKAVAPESRGVFKFRTIEEAQKAREKYTPLK